MLRSCSRDDLRTGSAAFLSWPSTLSLRLMRLFEHLRSKDAGAHTLSTAAKLQPLGPPVSWASADYRLRRCNHKAGAWKMHANLADLAITTSDHDLMDVRGDQFTDNRIASSIVRRDGNGLARFSTVGILGIDRRRGNRYGIRARSSACRALIWLRPPWPIAAMRSAQVWSLGKPSSGGGADPKFCRKYQAG